MDEVFCCAGKEDKCRSCRVYAGNPQAKELSDALLMMVHAAQHHPSGAPGDGAELLLGPCTNRAYALWRRQLGLPEQGA